MHLSFVERQALTFTQSTVLDTTACVTGRIGLSFIVASCLYWMVAGLSELEIVVIVSLFIQAGEYIPVPACQRLNSSEYLNCLA
jgi:hypothetical protein